jgi:hypothetical protein
VSLPVLDDEDSGAVVGEDANDVEPVLIVEVGVFASIVHH